MNDEKIFINPIDNDYFKKLYIVMFFIILICIIVAIITGIIYYIISGIFFAALGYSIEYYNFNYYKPSQIIIGNDGLMLIYRKKRKRLISWREIDSLFVSNRQDNITEAAIRLFKGRPILISREIALEVEAVYQSIFGRPILEWNGR